MPPSGLQLVNDDRQVRHCACRIRDSACLGCGQVIGYHVTQPCNDCLQDQNNGHFWMFYSSGVLHFRRIHKVGSTDTVMLWADVPSTAYDQCLAEQLRAAIPTLGPRRQQPQRLVITASTLTSSEQGGGHSAHSSSHGGAGAGASEGAGVGRSGGTATTVADERPPTAWIDMEDWLKSPIGDIVCR
ncbi:Protein fam72a [Actinomortierella ambigua]|uniref:Protein fam72a n=1 Tax=Actinomortierella ambigua TaxID=1343610 RepID=A0A9P6QGA2_9FUNG|nr:Protein fam72a [Actinomortierella ambigua]